MRVFLSFPARFQQERIELEKVLQKEGYEVTNPNELYLQITHETVHDWVIDCLRKADVLVLHTDYVRVGAYEVGYAIHIGIPVFPINYGCAIENHLNTWMIPTRSQQVSFSTLELLQRLTVYKKKDK